MELLLGFAPYSRITKDETRRLMRPVLSTEIVFWGSQAGAGANGKERQQYFWNRFVVPMLNMSGGRIIFLVGMDVQKTFRRVQTTPLYNRFGEEFVVVRVNHFSQGTQNYSSAANLLISQEKSNHVIHNALQEVRRIYNQ